AAPQPPRALDPAPARLRRAGRDGARRARGLHGRETTVARRARELRARGRLRVAREATRRPIVAGRHALRARVDDRRARRGTGSALSAARVPVLARGRARARRVVRTRAGGAATTSAPRRSRAPGVDLVLPASRGSARAAGA